MITNARSTPGSGWSTTVWRLVSHLPRIAETSSLPRATSPSISGLRPTVPMMVISRPLGAAPCERVGRTPVTRSMSLWRSPATRTTPAQSRSLTRIGAARPFLTSAKLPRRGVNEMYAPGSVGRAAGP